MIFHLCLLDINTGFPNLNPRHPPQILQGLKYRRLRVTAFVTLALSGFIPLAHGLIIYGWNRMWVASGMPYYLLEAGILILAAFFYATRYPESVRPRKFDIWGCSHNIFHVLVVLAPVVHLVGIWIAFAYNYRHLKCHAWNLNQAERRDGLFFGQTLNICSPNVSRGTRWCSCKSIYAISYSGTSAIRAAPSRDEDCK